MFKKPHPEKNPESHPARPINVIGVCPDGHETQIQVAPMLAVVGSPTGEQCLKRAEFGGACGKYLKVKRVIGPS